MSSTETPDGVDLGRLAPWFATNVPGYAGTPLTATLIAGVTFVLGTLFISETKDVDIYAED